MLPKHEMSAFHAVVTIRTSPLVQASLVWYSISKDFTPEEVNLGTAPYNCNAARLRALGYDVNLNKFLATRNDSSTASPAQEYLRIMRIWYNGTIAPQTLSRIHPPALETTGLKDYALPIEGEPTTKAMLAAYMHCT